jgi:hypothetical protein
MKKILTLILISFSIAVAQAGLKEWIHGSPPVATPGPPDAKAANVSFAADVAPDKPIMDFMLAFAEALRVHDGTALKPRVSERFTVEGAPEERSATDFLMQAIVKAKSNSEIVITSVQPTGDVRVATVEFRSADRPTRTKTFRFDAEGKLIGTDFFALQRHGLF